MAYEGFVLYHGVELINVARLDALCQALGIDAVRVNPRSAATLRARFENGYEADGFGFGNGPFGDGGFGNSDVREYNDPTQTPWYDAQYPASAEFAGLMPLSLQGLDDSSLESTAVEYITDGGYTGSPRSGTKVVVGNVVIVASTERGAMFGKRWLDQTLRARDGKRVTSEVRLTFLRELDADSSLVHLRKVRLTRGTSVTRKRVTACHSLLYVTFTLTAGDAFTYEEPVLHIDNLGGTATTGPHVFANGTLTAAMEDCPVYDYTPVYDPVYPALVAPPTPPNFLPDGWRLNIDNRFYRSWAAITALEPTMGTVVPFIKVTGPDQSTSAARFIRISFWSSDNPAQVQCGALYSVVISYLPVEEDLYIDGEQKAAYFWDGVSPYVRRADTLVYSETGGPMRWEEFPGGDAYLVTMDFYADETARIPLIADMGVRAEVSLISKSD